MLRTLFVVLGLLLPRISLGQPTTVHDAGILDGTVAQAPSAAPSDSLGLRLVLEPPIPNSGPVIASGPASSATVPPVAEGVVPTAGEVKLAIDAIPVIKEAVQAPTVFGVCSAVALVVNLVISFLRRRGNLASRKRVKQFLAFAVALAAGLALVTPGMSWAMAAFVALSPLFSVVGYELFKSSK